MVPEANYESKVHQVKYNCQLYMKLDLDQVKIDAEKLRKQRLGIPETEKDDL